MKKLITICLLVINSMIVFAQEKTSLTIGETVNYLNKKIKEIEGFSTTPSGGSLLTYVDAEFTFEE